MEVDWLRVETGLNVKGKPRSATGLNAGGEERSRERLQGRGQHLSGGPSASWYTRPSRQSWSEGKEVPGLISGRASVLSAPKPAGNGRSE